MICRPPSRAAGPPTIAGPEQIIQFGSDDVAGSMSSGTLLSTLLTWSVTTSGVRSGSGVASSIFCTSYLSVAYGSNHCGYMLGGMMTGARSWTWPRESRAVVVRTVEKYY